jgi:hypothetical protein
MKTFVQAHGFDVWQAVVDGYKAPATLQTDKYGKKVSENNSKDKYVIISGLDSLVYIKCYTSKLLTSMMTYCRHYKCRKCHTLATNVASVTNIILSSCLCRISNDITRNT